MCTVDDEVTRRVFVKPLLIKARQRDDDVKAFSLGARLDVHSQDALSSS